MEKKETKLNYCFECPFYNERGIQYNYQKEIHTLLPDQCGAFDWIYISINDKNKRIENCPILKKNS